MQHWFIATEPFSSSDGTKWNQYVSWSGLAHLNEIVSLDPMLCPTVLPTIKNEYWPHIVNEDFMLSYFVDLDFLLEQVSGMKEAMNLLCVCRNPPADFSTHEADVRFEFLGYDLVDVMGSASALTNCGGFPDAFESSELSPKGLLTSRARALEVQAKLRSRYPEHQHADCHVWAISRAVASVV